MFEHYTMCIPMFVPTKRYMMELYEQGHEVLREVSWNQIKGLPSKSAIPGKSEQPDPNDYENMGAVQHWLQYADYYSDWMRHVIQFDSMEDLAGLLETTNFQKVSNSMMLHNVERMSFSLNAWNEILKEIK